MKKRIVQAIALVMVTAMVSTGTGIAALAETGSLDIGYVTGDINGAASSGENAGILAGQDDTAGDDAGIENGGTDGDATGTAGGDTTTGQNNATDVDKNGASDSDDIAQGSADSDETDASDDTSDEKDDALDEDADTEDDSDEEDLSDEEIASIQARIDALPTLDEFKALKGDAVEGSVLNSAQMAYMDEDSEFYKLCDTYFALADDDKARLDATKLTDIYDYLQSPQEVATTSPSVSASVTADGYLQIEVTGTGSSDKNRYCIVKGSKINDYRDNIVSSGLTAYDGNGNAVPGTSIAVWWSGDGGAFAVNVSNVYAMSSSNKLVFKLSIADASYTGQYSVVQYTEDGYRELTGNNVMYYKNPGATIATLNITLLKGDHMTFYSDANCKNQIYGLVYDSMSGETNEQSVTLKPDDGYAWSDYEGKGPTYTDSADSSSTSKAATWSSSQNIYYIDSYNVPTTTGINTLTVTGALKLVTDAKVVLQRSLPSDTTTDTLANGSYTSESNPYKIPYDGKAIDYMTDVTYSVDGQEYTVNSGTEDVSNFLEDWYTKNADGSWETYRNTVDNSIVIKDAGIYKVIIQFEVIDKKIKGEITKYVRINPKQVSVSGITCNNKVYDGTTTATLDITKATISGLLDSDKSNVSLQAKSGTSATFAKADVGENIAITHNLELTGDAASNYDIPTDLGLKANITPMDVSTKQGVTVKIAGIKTNTGIKKETGNTYYTVPFNERKISDMTFTVSGVNAAAKGGTEPTFSRSNMTFKWYKADASWTKSGDALSDNPSSLGNYLINVTAVSDDGNYTLTKNVPVMLTSATIAGSDVTINNVTDTGLQVIEGDYYITQKDSLDMGKATYSAKLEGEEAEILSLDTANITYTWYKAGTDGAKTGNALSGDSLKTSETTTPKPATTGSYILEVGATTSDKSYTFTKELAVKVESSIVEAPVKDTDFTVTGPTIKNKADAKIEAIGTGKPALEIAKKGSGSDALSFSTEAIAFTNLEPGTYVLRFYESDANIISREAEVTIADSTTMISLTPETAAGYTITSTAASVAYNGATSVTVTFTEDYGFLSSVTSPTISLTSGNTVVATAPLTKLSREKYTAEFSNIQTTASAVDLTIALTASQVQQYTKIAPETVKIDLSSSDSDLQADEDGGYTLPYDGEGLDVTKLAPKVTVNGEEITWDQIIYEWYDSNKNLLTEQPTAVGEYILKIKAYKDGQYFEKDIVIRITAHDLSDKAEIVMPDTTVKNNAKASYDASAGTCTITLDQMIYRNFEPTIKAENIDEGTEFTYTYTYKDKNGNTLSSKPTSTGSYVLTVEAKSTNGKYTYKKDLPLKIKLDSTVSFAIDNQSTSTIPEVTLKEDAATVIERAIKGSNDLDADSISDNKDKGGIKIKLVVQDISSTTPTEKTTVEAQLKGNYAKYKIGQIADISLVSYNNSGKIRSLSITEIDKPVTITYKMPSSLKNTNSNKTRTYCVVRSHDKGIEFLSTSYNEDNFTLTFESDRFSNYYIIYKDTAKTTTATTTDTDTTDAVTTPAASSSAAASTSSSKKSNKTSVTNTKEANEVPEEEEIVESAANEEAVNTPDTNVEPTENVARNITVDGKKTFDLGWVPYVSVGILILLAVFAFVYWRKYGKDSEEYR